MSTLLEEQTLTMPLYAEPDETRFSARYRWSCRERGPQPFVILQWTRSGCGLFRCCGKETPVPPGTAFIALVPEDAEYLFEPGAPEPWRFSWINFYGALSLRLWAALRTAAGPVITLAPESEPGLHLERLIADTHARRFADRYEASLAAYLFFTSLHRQLDAPRPLASGRTSTVEAVQNLAARRPANVPLGVKTVAAEAGVSREHFSRVFKARLGKTPGRFLRAQRLQNAEEMLRTTALPLKEIALRCGFTSARHLADAYRAKNGDSPHRRRVASGG